MATVSPQQPASERPEGFDQEIRDLVEATAPQLFAVVEEFASYGGELDARVAAWGLAHQDGTAHVTTVDGASRMSLRTPDRAAEWISRRAGCLGRVVWVRAAEE